MHSIWNYPNLAPGTLDRTIAALRDARVGRMVIVGPPPMWTGGLPQAILTLGLGVNYISLLDMLCNPMGAARAQETH